MFKIKLVPRARERLELSHCSSVGSLREGGRGLNDSQTVLLVKENILESSPVMSGRAGGWKTEFQSWFWLFSDSTLS